MEYNKIYQCDCHDLAAMLPKGEVNLIFTSPPYANQRKKQYGGMSEAEYPEWTVKWAEAFKESLTFDGSIAIVIRPHIKNGQISDYVLKTRLAMREANWLEAEELIWIKPDSPPLGHIGRPRRAWESILWFAKSKDVFCKPKANGSLSNRIGFESIKGVGEYKSGTSASKTGIARCRDYIEVGTGSVDKSTENKHPAQFPPRLAKWVIKLLCPQNGIVCDPFMGSGTTAIACESLNFEENFNLKFVGSEIKEQYFQISNERLKKWHDGQKTSKLEFLPTKKLSILPILPILTQ